MITEGKVAIQDVDMGEFQADLVSMDGQDLGAREPLRVRLHQPGRLPPMITDGKTAIQEPQVRSLQSRSLLQ